MDLATLSSSLAGPRGTELARGGASGSRIGACARGVGGSQQRDFGGGWGVEWEGNPKLLYLYNQLVIGPNGLPPTPSFTEAGSIV